MINVQTIGNKNIYAGLIILCIISCLSLLLWPEDKNPQDKDRAFNGPPPESELSEIIGETISPTVSKHFRLESTLPVKDTDAFLNDAEVCFHLFEEIMGIPDGTPIWGAPCRLWVAKNDAQYKIIIESLYDKERDAETIRDYLAAVCFRRTAAPYPFMVCGRAYQRSHKPTTPKLTHMIAHQMLYAWVGYFELPVWIEEGACLYLGVKVNDDNTICLGKDTMSVGGNENRDWYDTKKWPDLLIKDVGNKKDTPLQTLAKRTDTNSIKPSEKAKIYSVISFLIREKEPIENSLDDPSKRRRTNLGKLIFVLRNKPVEESLAAVYNGLTIEKLDAEWREWILNWKKYSQPPKK